MASHTQTHPHGYHDEHDNIHSDPGPMYRIPWVQQLITQIQTHLTSNNLWLGLDPSKEQRVLDYACGHGTVSTALVPLNPLTTFCGLDIATSQVGRFNDEATKLLGEKEARGRMFATQGDLTSPTPELMNEEWHKFDIAIISMALHHIIDPPSLLTLLRERVRIGGVIVVVDWLKDDDGGIDGEDGSKYDEAKMKQLEHGPKIWPGFSERGIENDLKAAGCEGVEVKVFDLKLMEMPEFMRGQDRLFIAKAVVV